MLISKKKYLTHLLMMLFVVSQSSVVFADLIVTDTTSGTPAQIFNSSDVKTENFFQQAEKYKIYGAQYFLDTKPTNEWEVISADDGLEVVSSEAGTYILTGAAQGAIHLKNISGQELKLTLEWKPLQKKVLRTNCGKKEPRFVVEGSANEEFLLATHCRLENKNLYITVSTMSDVQWQSSSLFEAAGKGERWRYYQVPATSAKGGAIAELKFKVNETEKTFKLVMPKDEDGTKKDQIKKEQEVLSKKVRNELRMGLMGLGFSADSVSSTDSKISLGYTFLSSKYFENYRFGGSFDTSLEVGKKVDGLSFMESLIYAGYVHPYNEQTELSAYLGFQYADFQQQSSATRLQNAQIGLFLTATYLLDASNRVGLTLYKTSFSSKTVKNNLAIELEYKFKLEDYLKGMWVGASYKAQSFDASNEAGASRQFSENIMGVSLVF